MFLRQFKTLLAGVAYSYGMDVEGDIAEFGTMTGRTAVGLAVAQKFMTHKYKNVVRKNKKFGSLIALRDCLKLHQE